VKFHRLKNIVPVKIMKQFEIYFSKIVNILKTKKTSKFRPWAKIFCKVGAELMS